MTSPGALHRGIYWTCWGMFSSQKLFALLRLTWVIANNLYCIPSYFAWMLLFSPLLLLRPVLFWRIEQVFFDWLLSMVACWSVSAGYKIKESGADLESLREERFIYMPNHQSTADVPMCMTTFVARRSFCSNVMWIMDKVFKYTNFGWVSWLHNDFFILAGKTNRENSLKELEIHLRQVFIPMDRRYLVLFPEGGFLRNRKKVSQSFAKKADLPNLEYVTLPRTGALEVILDVLVPQHRTKHEDQRRKLSNGSVVKDVPRALSKIVDVTIAYPEGRPLDLVTIASGLRTPCTTYFHYRVFDVDDIPSDTEEMKKWMYQLYVDKEKMLAQYYKTGVFPHDLFDQDALEPREVIHDPLRFFILHMFFMFSSCLLWNFTEGIRHWLLSLAFPN